MLIRLVLLAVLGAVAVAIAMLSFDRSDFLSTLRVTSAAAEEETWIKLRDDVEVRFLHALDVTPTGGGEAEFVANFALKDQAVLEQHEKLISSSDQLFGRFVMLAAHKAKRTRAGVNFLISESGPTETTAKVQVFEDFHYAQQANGVWLRQAGAEPWKIAQDPNWVHPESEKVELAGIGTIEIDFIGSIFGPATATRSLGIEIRSPTPVTNVNAKYAEMRALWYRIDREKLKTQGFDFVEIENFTEKKAGRFQIRQYVYLRISRPAGGDWPEVPISPVTDPNAPLTASLEQRPPYDAVFAVGKAVAESGESTMVRVALPASAAVAGPANGLGFDERGAARVPLRALLNAR